MGQLEFSWTADFTAEKPIGGDLGPSLVIKGTFIDTSVNKNGWAIDESELEKIASQLSGVQLRIDHGRSVRDIVGGFTKGILNKEQKKIDYEAEIDDGDIIKKVLKGRVKFVSPGLTADAFCSECGKPTRPFKSCKCESYHEIIKNCETKEGSIISEPAFSSTKFEPVSFSASVEKTLASQDNKKVLSGEKAKVEENKTEEKREMSAKEEPKKEGTPAEVQATEKKPAGTDAFILLGEKLEAFTKKLEEVSAKLDSAKSERKGEEEEDEEKKKENEEEDESKTKKEVTKDEEIKALMKDVLAKLNEQKKEGEGEDEDKKPPKKEEKATSETKGAHVDTKEDMEGSWEPNTISQEELRDKAWKEVLGAAKAYRVID
jgi:hypothetical protein